MLSEAGDRGTVTLRVAPLTYQSAEFVSRGTTMNHEWKFSTDDLDWEELSDLFRIASLSDQTPVELQVCFANSRHVCLVFDQGRLIGAGRVVGDGLDCAYMADVAVHPEYQGAGIGTEIVSRLVQMSSEHRKIILYAAPGKEDFYRRLGFRPMTTAMALFQDEAEAIARGVVGE